ncbi:MAG: hypothetical protein A4E28_02509 [Methanocella sp. PtaU1.Bin125]|nr:MAG: hypothetical protein A4E28_02509 [Methanocella sp. PtaU1.Bin125]
MQAKHAAAIITGIFGGIIFTLFMTPVAALDVMATSLAAYGLFDISDSRFVISVLGYLLYPVCGVIFLAAGFMAVRLARPYLKGTADVVTVSVLSGLTAGVIRAVAYDVLWASRPIAESAIYLLLATRSFDVHAYRMLLSGDAVVGYAGPWYAPASLIVAFLVDGLIILIGSLVLALAGGMLYVALSRVKKGVRSRLEPVEQQRV